MTTSSALLSLLLRRSTTTRRPSLYSLFTLSQPIPSRHLSSPPLISHFSTTSYTDDNTNNAFPQPDEFFNSTNSQLLEDSGIIDYNNIDDVESSLPVRTLVSLLDGYHDFTGFPWWIIISSSTFALRLGLFPVLVYQLKKLRTIQDFFPKLPRPFPPPLSGRSYVDQFSLFRKERCASGCPSYLWFFAYFSIQVPCFFLWMTTIRRMSLDHHPGFDCGGTLWFQNLTEYPHGLLAPILPLLIAGLHYTNVQISFEKSSIRNVTGILGLLAKYYKTYLDLLTLPLVFIAFCIPQGSLVYWVTNSSLTVIQQLSLRHPAIRKKLGLPDKGAAEISENLEGLKKPEIESSETPTKPRIISAQDLTPEQLLKISVKYLAKGEKDRAVPLLRLALDKDPDYIRALMVMGQTLMQEGLPAEATEYLERAISKLLHDGLPTETEEFGFLILASQWAGVAYVRQNKKAEGIVHLQRITSLNEPEDKVNRAHYYDGFMLLASALLDEGRKDEAEKYLRKAAAYDPKYNELLEQCLKDDDFVKDLANSRRAE